MGQEDPDLKQRAKSAKKIARYPEQYKVCVGCDSIVASKAHLCPNCHAYRFVEDVDYVIAQADNLSRREQQTVVSEDLY